MRGKETNTGARSADRNILVANWFSIARSVWDMHDAVLIEQRRTNQLLETLIEMRGGTIPTPHATPEWEGIEFDDSGQVIERDNTT